MDLNLWRAAKKEQHLTIAEIAERACLPKGTVQNIFGGNVPNLRTDTVDAIEGALGKNEKSPTVRDAQSDIAENFVKEFGELFTDEAFIKTARLYKLMTAAQRLMILGVIIGHMEKAGIDIPPMLR